MQTTFDESWQRVLQDELSKPYFTDLARFVDEAYQTHTVYPPKEKIFEAFRLTPFESVKVVLLGQDPYHEPEQAQGLAFYVPSAVRPPPSLRNLAKERATDCQVDFAIPDLLAWARQGVLLLNTTLTVEAHRAGSHQGRGWETFTDAVIHQLATTREHLVFLLWGSFAQKKGAFIDRARHCVIESAHPSPLSAYRGFFGSKPFSKTNAYLSQWGVSPIAW